MHLICLMNPGSVGSFPRNPYEIESHFSLNYFSFALYNSNINLMQKTCYSCCYTLFVHVWIIIWGANFT